MITRFTGPTRITRLVYVVLLFSAVALLSCQKQPPPSHEQHPTAAAPTPATAATPMTGPPGYPPAVMGKSYPGTGVVVLINRKEGWIEINHDDIKDLMPAMQMEFNVQDKSLLDRVAVGDRVDFTIIETPKGEYLTAISKKKN